MKTEGRFFNGRGKLVKTVCLMADAIDDGSLFSKFPDP